MFSRISQLVSTTTGFLLFQSSLHGVSGEIRTFEGPIEAAPSYIHYSEGFVVTPGYVDISNLVFSTVEDERSDASASQVEIILFNEPKNCAKDGQECDWAELGVGGEDENGGLRWCCWEDASDLGLCSGKPEDYGKMIIDESKFDGKYISLNVPSSGHQDLHVKQGMMEIGKDKPSGKYILVMSNCNYDGRDLTASGEYVWMSDHGYLPGDLFGEMYFYISMTILYVFLFAWYGVNMKKYEDSRIPIQNYILVTIGMGFAEAFFRAGDYWVWNEDGMRFWFSMYTGIVLGVVKRTFSRCLMVMVCLGWGVIRDELNEQIKKIYTLSAFYFLTSGAVDVLKVLSIVENEVLGPQAEEEVFDVIAVLTFAVACVDVSFYMWILDALHGTMSYLEEMEQKRKMKRYLSLRLVLLLSILFAIVWAVFGIVNTYLAARMLDERHEWGVQAAWEVNYFFILASVSILWKPDPNAKEYAYVMELPSMANDDLQFSTNDNVEEDDDEDDDVNPESGEEDKEDDVKEIS